MAYSIIDKSVVLVSQEQSNNYYCYLKNNKTPMFFIPITLPIAQVQKTFTGKNTDLILLDCGHNGERGLGWLTEFKRVRKDIPVIFITSLRSHDLVLRAYKLGSRDYFSKPLSVPELNRRIDELLSLKKLPRERRSPLLCTPVNLECEKTNTMMSDIPARMACTVHYIEENISNSINLEELSRQANLSKYHFARSFKQLTGFSPLEFTNILKMHKAKKLLIEQECSVTQAAEEIGYVDLRNFCRRFKKHTGLTPSLYRNLFITKT